MEASYLICFILCMTFQSANSLPSFALGQLARVGCFPDSNTLSLIDGDTTGNKFATLDFSCPKDKKYAAVEFDRLIYVSHVIVYSGNVGNCSDCNSGLNYFKVSLSKDIFYSSDFATNGVLTKCGLYYGPALMPGKPMRVNCRRPLSPIKYVVIQPDDGFDQNVSMAIDEIEVYELDFLMNLHTGCFSSKIVPTVAGSSDECFQTCHKTHYAAVRGNNECICTSVNWTEQLSPFNCSMDCTNNIDPCGGPGAYSIYKTVISPRPYYVGCFHDETSKYPSKNEIQNLTIQHCLNYCMGKGHMATVLKRSEICDCRKDLKGLIAVNESDCNLPCTGNSTQICGGEESLSIYTGCYERYHVGTCGTEFHCNENSMDEFGVCSEGCISGWKGESCNVPTKDLCQDGICDPSTTECQSKGNTAKCYCKPGYIRLSNTMCADVDECKKNPCKKLQECQNIPGSFLCTCEAGYSQEGSNCFDKDECLLPDACDPKSSTCENQIGSYKCICNEGYRSESSLLCVIDPHPTVQPAMILGKFGTWLLTVFGFFGVLVIILGTVVLRQVMKKKNAVEGEE